jgi:two-component system invasion response regulator UvrY
MINILIADDHAIVREGLKQILTESPSFHVSDEAASGQEVIEKIWENDYDVVILDISMPGRSGLEVLKQIRAVKPQIPVLILSMHPECQYAVRALKAGAAGYLTKESAPAELISAIEKVAGGNKFISTSLAEKIATDLEAGIYQAPHESLSDREYQVMCMIASGKTVKQIADELCLSVKTISTYRSRMLGKMRMKNNAELTYYAIKHELVT